ncbi:MAG: hypothetical protein QM775_04115 [Pirellulales bacterium]
MTQPSARLLIAVLDDESEHSTLMHTVLHEVAGGYAYRFFDNAPDMISALPGLLDQVCLISLDHDLGPNRHRDGTTFDPGTGRDVADALALHKPVCPIMIHTSNGDAAPGMRRVLEESGWLIHRVFPHDDTAWIRDDWRTEIITILNQRDDG